MQGPLLELSELVGQWLCALRIIYMISLCILSVTDISPNEIIFVKRQQRVKVLTTEILWKKCLKYITGKNLRHQPLSDSKRANAIEFNQSTQGHGKSEFYLFQCLCEGLHAIKRQIG